MSLPAWTSYEKGTEDHQGLYPLGLEPYGAAIARYLLPGITNVTIHIRYYSFLSWVFWTFQAYYRQHGSKLTAADQKKWRVRLENIHRAATLSVSPTLTGVVGVSEVIALKNRRDSDVVDVGSGRAATPFQAAFYSASFQILRCGLDQNGVVGLTGLGERLARAFDEKLKSVPGGSRAYDEILSGKDRVSVRAIRTLAEGLTLRAVPVGSTEHEELVQLLFRLGPYAAGDPNAVSEGRRRRCLGLLLDIVGQSNGQLESARELQEVFASRRFQDRTEVVVPPAFEQEFVAWERFQERQYEKLGLYGLWDETLALLRRSSQATGTDQIVAHLFRVVEASAVARRWLGESPLSIRVVDALARVKAVCDRLARRENSPIHTLANQLLSENGEHQVGGTAVVLLLLVLAQWQAKRGGLGVTERRIHDTPRSRNRLVLGWLLQETEARSQLSLGEYVRWLTERCLLGQANQIALEKLAADQYRFFILRDSDGYRLIRDQGAGAYLDYDSRRFPAAYRLLEGLELVSLEGPWRLTPAGRKVLKRVLAHDALA